MEKENWVRQKVDANVHAVDAHTCVTEREIESDREKRERRTWAEIAIKIDKE